MNEQSSFSFNNRNKRKAERSASSSEDEEDEREKKVFSPPRQELNKRFSHKFVNVPNQQQRLHEGPVNEQTNWKEQRTPSPRPPSPPRHRITVTTNKSFDDPLRVQEDSDSYEDDESSYSSYYSQSNNMGGIHQDTHPGGAEDVQFTPFSIGGANRKKEHEPNVFGISSWTKPIEGGILRNSTTQLGNTQNDFSERNFNAQELKKIGLLKQDALTKARRSARLPRSRDENIGVNRNLYRQSQRLGKESMEMDISTLQAAEARKNRLASNRSKGTGTPSTPVSQVRSMRKARLQNWR